MIYIYILTFYAFSFSKRNFSKFSKKHILKPFIFRFIQKLSLIQSVKTVA